MRLIDADRLQRRIEGELSLIEETLKTSKNERERSHLLIMISGRNGFIKEIKKADTVESIPVSYIKEMLELANKTKDYHSATVFEAILKDWESGDI